MMKVYSRPEAAKLLCMSLSTLDRMRAQGRIGYIQVRPGFKVQFTQEHLDNFLADAEKKPNYGFERRKRAR